MSLIDSVVASAIPWVPRALVRRIASRYIAGPTLAHALARTRRLADEGFPATLDVLGESAADLSSAHAAEAAYVELLAALAGTGLDADVSIKPTALGLLLDAGACEAAIGRLASQAAALGRRICLDMEESRCTQAEIDLFIRLRAGGAPLALALQAYLRRTAADAAQLAAAGHPLRVCKGIYREPEPLLVPGAGRDRRAINAPFLQAVEACFAHGVFVSVATHDEALVEDVAALARRLAIAPGRFEFQMLLGVREPLRDALRRRGFAVRVYVPFGADWHGYGTRRLKENPRVAGLVARAMFGR